MVNDILKDNLYIKKTQITNLINELERDSILPNWIKSDYHLNPDVIDFLDYNIKYFHAITPRYINTFTVFEKMEIFLPKNKLQSLKTSLTEILGETERPIDNSSLKAYDLITYLIKSFQILTDDVKSKTKKNLMAEIERFFKKEHECYLAVRNALYDELACIDTQINRLYKVAIVMIALSFFIVNYPNVILFLRDFVILMQAVLKKCALLHIWG